MQPHNESIIYEEVRFYTFKTLLSALPVDTPSLKIERGTQNNSIVKDIPYCIHIHMSFPLCERRKVGHFFSHNTLSISQQM